MPPHENEEHSCFSPGMTRWLSAACFCAVGTVIFFVGKRKYIQKHLHICKNIRTFAAEFWILIQIMKIKNQRLEAIRLIISSQQLGNQEELMAALQKEGFSLTQATLSRDLKQLKVAKASTLSGQYIYVLPNETMYKRVNKTSTLREMLQMPGFLSISFSGNMGVIKTRPGYASAIAWNIDRSDITQILGTIAGDDTIFIVLKEGVDKQEIIELLGQVVPNMKGGA